MQEGPRYSKDLEIKYWEFPVGPTGHAKKVSSIIECTFILAGTVTGELDGHPLTLTAGDYVVIHPGTPNNLAMDVTAPVAGMTIKAPSDTVAKTILP